MALGALAQDEIIRYRLVLDGALAAAVITELFWREYRALWREYRTLFRKYRALFIVDSSGS